VERLPVAVFDINITRNNESKAYAVMPMAYDVEFASPALLLIWVLALSSAFQTYRSKHLPFLLRHGTVTQVQALVLGAHMLLHAAVWTIVLMLWKGQTAPPLTVSLRWAFLLLLTPLCLFIVSYQSLYRNTSADFGRWLEYAMTAPVQVVIVALTVWTRDRATLYALGAAQAAMMLCGVVIEECITNIYQTNRTSGDEDDEAADAALLPTAQADRKQRRRRAVRTALGTLVIAWATYALIWYVLIAQFRRQDNITGKCDGCHEHNLTCTNDANTTAQLEFLDVVLKDYIGYQNKSQPPVFSATTALQLQDLDVLLNVSSVTTLQELFALFDIQGMPSLAEILRIVRGDIQCKKCPLVADGGLCEARDGLCQGQNDIPSAVQAILGVQALLFGLFGVVQTVQLFLVTRVRGAAAAEEAWYAAALAYAVLSVTAKTALEIGFLVMLTQMPSDVTSA